MESEKYSSNPQEGKNRNSGMRNRKQIKKKLENGRLKP